MMGILIPLLSFFAGASCGVILSAFVLIWEDFDEDEHVNQTPVENDLITIDQELQKITWGDWTDKPQ